MTVLSSTVWPDSARPETAHPETRPTMDSDSFEDLSRDEIRDPGGVATSIADRPVESIGHDLMKADRLIAVDAKFEAGFEASIETWPPKEVKQPERFVSPLLVRGDDREDDESDDDSADADDEKSGFGDDLDDGQDDLDEFDDIDEDDFDDDFDDDFEEELDDDYEIAIDDEISAEFGLNTAGEDIEDEQDDLDDFEDFDAID